MEVKEGQEVEVKEIVEVKGGEGKGSIAIKVKIEEKKKATAEGGEKKREGCKGRCKDSGEEEAELGYSRSASYSSCNRRKSKNRK